MSGADQKCLAAECARPVGKHGARGYCPTHYSRVRTTGSAEKPVVVVPPCSVEGCNGLSRKRSWCAAHYSQWKRNGEVRPFLYKWARQTHCIVCGKPNPGQGRTCSVNCRAQDSRHKGARPQEKPCEQCGQAFSLLTRTKRGHFKRADTRLCHRCFMAHGTRHKMSVSELAARDGNGCGICHESIDLALRYPDHWSPSVDHIIPFARGGTHDPENLQLAHLRCNHLKSDRILN